MPKRIALLAALGALVLPSSASAAATINSATFTRGTTANGLVLTVSYSGMFSGSTFDFMLNTNDQVLTTSPPPPICSPMNSASKGGGICTFPSEPANPFVLQFTTASRYPDNGGGVIMAAGDTLKTITGPAPIPPSANFVGFLSMPVEVDNSGKAKVKIYYYHPEAGTLDLAGFAVFLGEKALGERSASASKAKQVRIGKLADAQFAEGQTEVTTTLKLTGKGKKALRRKRKLTVGVKGTLRNGAGSAQFSGKLKLVAKKSKKK